jgi:two-component system, chemotaxis family, sensor kinase Cph1
MTEQTVDLTNCEREPIHIPGLIQPHGVLLVLQELDLEIIQVSNNTFELLGNDPQDLLGKQLSEFIAPQQINSIRQCLGADFEHVNPLDISIQVKTKSISFDGIIHRQDGVGVVILELEPKQTEQKTDFFEFYQRVKGTITKIQKAPTLVKMCQAVVEEVRKITGFDRVMVYQFDADATGRVIAEDKLDPLTAYLGLHYPASDIPKQAKQLYTLNWLRLIPDSHYQPVGLVSANNSEQPLDLSLSVLRSVSPLHLEYLNNMQVAASMSISLIHNQRLWGLIACHHSTPRYVPYTVRTMCEFVAQVMSIELANKEAHEDLDYKMALKSLQGEFVTLLSQSKNFLDGLIQLDLNLLNLVSASGVAIFTQEQVICIGKTPPTEELPALRDWVKTQIQHNVFDTRSLAQVYPAAASFQAVASGLLALEISKTHQNYIFWFRPEVIQLVNWGGNPNKPVEVTANGEVRLSPRKSFEKWQETVQGCALPWKPCEIEIVSELRSLIVGIVLAQADELAKINIELERSNTELDSFAYIASHDLKEPLRGIHNYSNFLMEDYAEVLDADGVAKLNTLVRLTKRMEDLINSLLHYSRLGRAELCRQPTNLNHLLQQAIDTLRISQPQNPIEFRLPQSLPTILGDRTQLGELFTNLLTNAIKYNDKSDKWVEIGFTESETKQSEDSIFYTFYVRDNGIGIAQQHLERVFQIFKRLHARDEYGGGTGAGLTIVQKIVERHGGTIWIESTPGEGSTFYFTLAAGIEP